MCYIIQNFYKASVDGAQCATDYVLLKYFTYIYCIIGALYAGHWFKKSPV